MSNGRKRNNEIVIRLDLKELKKLKQDCKKAGINKSDYLRRLIMQKAIKEKPDEEFIFLLSELVKIGNEMRIIFHKADYLNLIDKDFYKEESDKWNNLITLIKKEYL